MRESYYLILQTQPNCTMWPDPKTRSKPVPANQHTQALRFRTTGQRGAEESWSRCLHQGAFGNTGGAWQSKEIVNSSPLHNCQTPETHDLGTFYGLLELFNVQEKIYVYILLFYIHFLFYLNKFSALRKRILLLLHKTLMLL